MTVEELLHAELHSIDRPAPSPETVRLLLARIEKRRVPGPEVVAGVCFILYAAISVQRHHRMESGGYDLGIFEQIVRAYAHGEAPIVELKGPGFNALGDHFHPILMLLAPAYRLFPAPETLLIAQAALIAASIIPIGRAAVRELGARNGTAMASAYGLSWGLLEAIGFDFHEICFAVPLLAFSLNRLLARRWTAAAAWAAPLVLVKEDLPLTTAAIGVYLLLRGRRRLGASLVLGGTATTVFIVVWVLPWFNPQHDYVYADQLGHAAHGSGIATKALTVILLLAPTTFVALRSPLLIVAVPTLAWRFLADNPNYWGTQYHYNAVLMPIVFAAFIDGLRWLPRRTPVVAAGVVIALAMACFHLPGRDEPVEFWRTPPAVSAALDALASIPDGATVAATTFVAPQLTARCRVRLLMNTPPEQQDAQWVAVGQRDFLSPPDLADWVRRLRNAGYRTAYESDTLILLRSHGSPG